jgi:hypothetical protein
MEEHSLPEGLQAPKAPVERAVQVLNTKVVTEAQGVALETTMVVVAEGGAGMGAVAEVLVVA